MTDQTPAPPVSPDFAAMAQTIYLALDDLDGFNGAAYLRGKLESLATLSHAAGRAKGLEEAAKWHEARLRGYMGGAFHRFSADAIRALASDPVAGDQVADFVPPYEGWAPYCLVCPTMQRMQPTDYGWKCRACGNPIDRALKHYHPAPAPGLAVQEVERLTAERERRGRR